MNDLSTKQCIGKVALFGKALVLALACGALPMCAMWVGFPSSFAEGRKKQNKFIQFAPAYPRAKFHFSLSIIFALIYRL